MKKTKLFFSVFMCVYILFSTFACAPVPDNENTFFYVRFDSQGGSTIPRQTVQKGGKITEPDDPEQDGFEFQGWYTDLTYNTRWDFNRTVESDMFLYAKWRKIDEDADETFTVYFETNGGSSIEPITNIKNGDLITQPDNPVRGDDSFIGWYRDSALSVKWNFETDVVRENMTLYAKYSAEPLPKYRVDFESFGGSEVSPILNVTEGDTINKPEDPVKMDCVFDGWYKDEDLTMPWNFAEDTVTGPTTLYAKWAQAPMPENVYSFYYKQLGSETMPIGAWVAPFNTYVNGYGGYVTRQNFINIKNAGLNSIYGLYDTLPTHKNDIIAALNHAAAVDLVYIPRINGLNMNTANDVINGLSGISDISSFGGLLLKDEPGQILFSTLAQMKQSFDAVFNQTDKNNKLALVNLFPNYATGGQLDVGYNGQGSTNPITYQKYVDDFVSIYNPQVLSYDFYPLSGSYPNISATNYFANMSLIANKAQASQIPFWVFIQSSTWSGSPRNATIEELYWQVNTALAYGCKGIQYFTYWSAGVEDPNFSNSFVDKDGTILPMYYKGQSVNSYIASIDHILMKSYREKMIKVGTVNNNLPTADLASSYKQLSSVSSTDNGSAIVGCFNYYGRTMLYIVNTVNSSAEYTFELNFDSNVGFTQYTNTITAGTPINNMNTYITNVTSKHLTGNKATVTLAGGQASLILLD